jgi:hypothetical protein
MHIQPPFLFLVDFELKSKLFGWGFQMYVSRKYSTPLGITCQFRILGRILGKT